MPKVGKLKCVPGVFPYQQCQPSILGYRKGYTETEWPMKDSTGISEPVPRTHPKANSFRMIFCFLNHSPFISTPPKEHLPTSHFKHNSPPALHENFHYGRILQVFFWKKNGRIFWSFLEFWQTRPRQIPTTAPIAVSLAPLWELRSRLKREVGWTSTAGNWALRVSFCFLWWKFFLTPLS